MARASTPLSVVSDPPPQSATERAAQAVKAARALSSEVVRDALEAASRAADDAKDAAGLLNLHPAVRERLNRLSVAVANEVAAIEAMLTRSP